MMERLLALIAAFCGALPAASGNCPELLSGQGIRMRILAGGTACVVVTVRNSEATQLSTEQPVDLAIRVSIGKEVTFTDGFEFGKETLTVLEPGEYRVELLPVDASTRTAWIFSMSRHAIPLQAAQAWRRAEVFGARQNWPPFINPPSRIIST